MRVYNSFGDISGQPYLLVKNEIVIEVSAAFADIIEYPINDLVSKNITEIFSTLRIGPNFDIKNIDVAAEYFLFTRTYEVKFFNINTIQNDIESLYIFIEKPHFNLETKFPFASSLLQDNHYGIAIFSLPDMTLLKANETYLGFLEENFNKKENCFGRRVSEYVTDFDGSTTEKVWNTILTTGKTFHIDEYTFYKLERGVTYWKGTFTPIFEDGKLKYGIKMTTEITEQVLERKRIEEQAKSIDRQKRELEAILENGNDIFCTFDINGKFIWFNKTARESKILKYSHIEKIEDGIKHAEYFDEKGDRILMEQFPSKRVLKGEKFEGMYIKVIGAGKTVHLSVSGTPVYDSNDNLIMGLLCLRDISKNVEYEEQLRKQNELLKDIMDNMQESMIVCDKHGNIIFADKETNEHFPDLLVDLKRKQEKSKIFYLNGEEVSFEDLPILRVLRGETTKGEIYYYECCGRQVYSMVDAKPVFDEKGNFIYGVQIKRNITDLIMSQRTLNEMQEKLLQIEREKNETLEKAMEMKDEFLSIISHEFRTPLNVINMAIQTLCNLYDREMTDKVKDYIGTIKLNTNRQLRLVNNLLDITRANAGRIKVNKKNIDIVFLTRCITESIYEYALQKKIEITFKSTYKWKIIGIDDEKYERIVLNLLSNAIKFTPEGKSITVHLCSMKGKICVEVKDTGIGIPPEKLDVIFERFGQVDSSLSRQAEGTGIGLSLVKKFVEALEGDIKVKSEVGNGTTFIILLPNETVVEEEEETSDLMDNRLIQTARIELSDIYL